ncbi:MAG: DinB family protein [Mucilaginibacter sp.]|uniref:DinB family protein n=1 Tax=Mucilaginibacter sp. TaxID=1882438 RepID=UPI0031B2E233
MKKLSLLLLMLTLTCTATFAQLTKEQIISEWTRAKAYTKAYLDAMPADGYTFKATPEVRSFAGQMLHLADDNYFFLSMVSGKPSPLAKGVSLEKTTEQNKEATTKAVLDSYDYAIGALQGMNEAQFAEELALGKLKSTRGLLLAKAFEHQTHHRGQATVYLRLKGVTPPQEMLF